MPDDTLFIIDTGASITITHNKYDFIGPVYPTQTMEIQGITAGLAIEGTGAAEYAFPTVAVILHQVLHIPKMGVHLLCPQHLAASTSCEGDGFKSISQVGLLACHSKQIKVQYNEDTGLLCITLAGSVAMYLSYCAPAATRDTLPVLHAALPLHTGTLSPV